MTTNQYNSSANRQENTRNASLNDSFSGQPAVGANRQSASVQPEKGNTLGTTTSQNRLADKTSTIVAQRPALERDNEGQRKPQGDDINQDQKPQMQLKDNPPSPSKK